MKNCGCNKHKFPEPKPLEFHPKDYFEEYSDLEKELVLHNLTNGNQSFTVENFPDGEDLTSVVENNKIVLKFADKEVSDFSGYGRKFLRKNIVTGDTCDTKINLLTQDMFKNKNGELLSDTLYIIQYDYDLNGKSIEIPCNSILLFLGGSFSNGMIYSSDCSIGNTQIFPYNFDNIFKNVDYKYIKFENGQEQFSCGKLKIYYNGVWSILSDLSEVTELKLTVVDLTKQVKAASTSIYDLTNRTAASEAKLTNLITAISKSSFTASQDVSSSTTKYALGTIDLGELGTVAIQGKDNNTNIQSVEVTQVNG